MRGNDRCSLGVTPSDASGCVKDDRCPTLLAQVGAWESPHTVPSTVTPCVSAGAFGANLKYNPLQRMEINKRTLLS